MVDQSLRGEGTFVEVHPDTHFSIENLPYGIFSTTKDQTHRIGVAIGEYVLDLREIERAGLFTGPILSSPETSKVLHQVQNSFSMRGFNWSNTIQFLKYEHTLKRRLLINPSGHS